MHKYCNTVLKLAANGNDHNEHKTNNVMIYFTITEIIVFHSNNQTLLLSLSIIYIIYYNAE